METKYPTLKRPRRKLCYFSDKDQPTKQRTGMWSLRDIDRMFDDLEPSDNEEDVVLPPSPLLVIDDTEANQSETSPSPIQQQESKETQYQKSPKGCSSHALPRLVKDTDLDFPAQGPLKTSSPIEESKMLDVGANNKKEDNDGEQATLQSLLSPKCVRSEKTLSSEEVVTDKPKAATPKTNIGDDPRRPAVQMPRKLDKFPTNMSTFLKNLRHGSQPTSSRKPALPVQASTAPEEDLFFLEDDVPLLFHIPRANSNNKRHSRTSGTVIDSQASQSSSENPTKTVQKEQEFIDASNKQHELKKNMKGKFKKTKIAEPQSHPEKLSIPAKTRVKQMSLEKCVTLDVKPQDTASEVTDFEEPPETMRKKSSKNEEVKKLKAVKPSKEVDKKKTALKMGRKRTLVTEEMPHIEAEIGGNQEQSNGEHSQSDNPASLSGGDVRNGEASKTKRKQKKLPIVLEESSSPESPIGGKRQRRLPGQWWMISALSPEGADVTERQPAANAPQQRNAESTQSPGKLQKKEDLEQLNEKEPVQSSNLKTTQARGKKPKQNKSRGRVQAKPRTTKAAPNVFVETTEEQRQQGTLDSKRLNSNLLVVPLRRHSSSSDQTVQRVYHNPSAKKTSAPETSFAGVFQEQLQETDTDKRKRKAPCEWWVVGKETEDGSPLPQPQQVKPVKGRTKTKQNKAVGLGSPQKGNMAASSKPAGVAPSPVKLVRAKKPGKGSLARPMDCLPTASETPSKASSGVTGPSHKQEVTVRDCSPRRMPETQDASGVEASKTPRVWESSRNQSGNTSKVIRSGPCSMIQLQDFQENDMTLPSTTVSTVLSVSDLCAAPLQPLLLQPKDRGNLSEWLRSLWSVHSGADISPDQFDWYYYQGRAFGIHVDVHSSAGSFLSGKMLLGSYMKKPLWVDHSATTVFHLLTSPVNVVINGIESRFCPSQTFVVPCGHAYSIQNVSEKPALLFFTRMFSEDSD